MGKDVESTVQKYEWALDHGDVPRSRLRSRDEQVERFSDAQYRIDEVRAMVRKTACRCGVPTIMMLAYYSFALAADKVMRRFDQATRAQQVAALLDRWEVRGLDPEVLRTILLEVFKYELPE